MQQSKEARRRLQLDPLFDWNTLTSAIPPPHAGPLLITDHNGEAMSSGRSRSKLSHRRQSTQSMEVEGTTTSVRMLSGPILLDLTHSSQRPTWVFCIAYCVLRIAYRGVGLPGGVVNSQFAPTFIRARHPHPMRLGPRPFSLGGM